MCTDTPGGSDGQRGVSNVLSVVLLLAIVVGGVAVVVTAGATALDDTRSELDTSRAEKALTQFDSRSAMVALGGTSRQGVDLAVGDDAGYRVEDGAGWMNVTIENESTGEVKTLANVTLGAVVYENGQTSLAYQGGGVWKGTEAGTTMLSPPEFHFRGATLTLPIITVDGNSTLGSGAVVTNADEAQIRYPNATLDGNFTNPLDYGVVNVTVHSDYYESWGRYFEERTEGEVSYDHDRDTAHSRLIVPYNLTFDHALAATEEGGIVRHGGGPGRGGGGGGGSLPDYETGVNYPSADSLIESRLEECQDVPAACDPIPADGDISTSGTYYAPSGYSGDLDIDTDDGNVTIVVNGDVKKPDPIVVSGSHHVEILVKGDFDINSDVNAGGDPKNIAVVLHSDGRFETRGNTDFYGLLYAPGSRCEMRGVGYFEGAAICKQYHFRGNPGTFAPDREVEDIELDLQGEITPITYLHVTVNPVNVTNG